jgi:hypothetical protein
MYIWVFALTEGVVTLIVTGNCQAASIHRLVTYVQWNLYSSFLSGVWKKKKDPGKQ